MNRLRLHVRWIVVTLIVLGGWAGQVGPPHAQQSEAALCARSSVIQAAVLTQLGATDCTTVTPEALATLTTLDLGGQTLASLTAAGGTTQTYTVTVNRLAPSPPDATLSALTFDSEVESYAVEVEHGVSRTTVTATATGTVAITPGDADGITPGHQDPCQKQQQDLTRVSVPLLLKGQDRANGRFVGTDMGKLRGHLIDQVCEATSGPCTYTGKSMLEAHKGVAVSEAEFDIVAAHFAAAITQAGVKVQDHATIMDVLSGMHDDLVGHRQRGVVG